MINSTITDPIIRTILDDMASLTPATLSSLRTYKSLPLKPSQIRELEKFCVDNTLVYSIPSEHSIIIECSAVELTKLYLLEAGFKKNIVATGSINDYHSYSAYSIAKNSND